MNVGFEVLTAVVMKISIVWDTKPRSMLKVSRRFGGTRRLHPKGRRIRDGRNQREDRGECSSETPVDFQRATRRYIAEDKTLKIFILYDGRNFLRTSVKSITISGGNCCC
jgi:hypothetical protein